MVMGRKWTYLVDYQRWDPEEKAFPDYGIQLRKFGDEGFDLVNVVKLDTEVPGSPKGTLLQYTFKREITAEELEWGKPEEVGRFVNYAEIPEGMDYISHSRYFSREFDRLFGDSWLLWKGNSNASGVGLSETVFDEIRTERSKLKEWHEKMRPYYSKTEQAFDAYWQYIKKISVYDK